MLVFETPALLIRPQGVNRTGFLRSFAFPLMPLRLISGLALIVGRNVINLSFGCNHTNITTLSTYINHATTIAAL
jgi:hypothetical protein